VVDIPIIFYKKDTLVSCNENKYNTIFSYKTEISLVQLYRFYTGEMERLGWQLIGSYLDQEDINQAGCCTLLFEKPLKFCLMTGETIEQEELLVKIVSGPKK
jgi:hypothetical protein